MMSGAQAMLFDDDKRMDEIEATNAELMRALAECRRHLNLLEEKIRRSQNNNEAVDQIGTCHPQAFSSLGN